MPIYSSTALERGLLDTLLRRGGLNEASLVQKLAYALNSKREDEKHEWLGQATQMSLFEGSRKTSLLTSTGYTITNKVYDGSHNISRDDFERNESGSMARRLNQIVDVAMSYPNQLITETVINGTSATLGLCYDGVSFYNNTHPARKDSGAQDNLLAGTGTTVAQISADIAASLTALRNVKAENGEPFHNMGLELCFMVPTSIEINFKTALNATIISNTSNQLMGLGEVIVNPRLVDVNDWYTFVKSPGSESLIFQIEQNVQFDTTMEDSDMWKQDRQGQVGVSAKLGSGYGFFQSSNKTVNS